MGAGTSGSPLTPETHVRNMLGELDCRDRAGRVALAYESGLITPGEPDRAPGYQL
jgi:hypothetical protein